MNAQLRQRVEGVLGLIATVLVIGGLYSWTYRVACISGAIGMFLVIVTLRFKTRAVKKQAGRTTDVYAAISRIRADRDARFEKPGRRRRLR